MSNTSPRKDFEEILEKITRPLTEDERKELLKPVPKETETSESHPSDDSTDTCTS